MIGALEKLLKPPIWECGCVPVRSVLSPEALECVWHFGLHFHKFLVLPVFSIFKLQSSKPKSGAIVRLKTSQGSTFDIR